MEMGWSLRFRDAIFTRGGEEFVWVDGVILKKKIFFFNDGAGWFPAG